MTIRNSIIYVLTKIHGRFHVLLCNKRGKYFAPGGIIERGEKPFDAAKREFQEEVERPLPRLVSVKRLDGKTAIPFSLYGDSGHTRLYASFVKDSDTSFNYLHYQGPKRNREVDFTEWVDMSVLFNRNFNWKKDYMQRSWNQVYHEVITFFI